MQWTKKYYLVLAFLLPCIFSNAQSVTAPSEEPGGSIPNTISLDTSINSAPFVVRNIFITGNVKTLDKIILREVPFKKGDHYQLQTLVQKFEDARRQLMNTSLFHEVVVALKSFDGYNVDVLISVKERWYLFPIPYFNVVARNFNEWIHEYNASLTRVNYGIKVTDNNFTGRKDKLRLALTNGYTKQVTLNYERPYFDEQMKWGVRIGIAAGKNRDVSYKTAHNKAVVLDFADNYIHSFLRSNFELTYRRAIRTTHHFGIAYNREKVGDTVIALNPSFFKEGRNSISYPEFYYNVTYFDEDFIPYPTEGYAADVTLSKKGLNSEINVWELTAKGSASWPVAKKMYFNTRIVGSIKLPFEQPFFNQRFLGYNDMELQGYEMYVIDGVAGGYLKATLGKELFNFNIKLPPIKYTKLNRIPFRVYGKIYGNTGYVYNPQGGDNFLTNKMLYSGGFGIDIVTVYDFVLKLEYSFNTVGQNGLYLHRKNQF
jgi:outer membrane protein assembly factor BamA